MTNIMKNISEYFSSISKEKIITSIVNIFFAIIIFLFFYTIAKISLKNIEKINFSKLNEKDNNLKIPKPNQQDNDNFSKIHRKFIAELVFYIIIIIGIFFALSRVGFNISSLLVILGTIGFAIAFGLQNLIQQIISGITILVFKYFNLGDLINVKSDIGYVKQFNFIRVETRWTDSDWGDAFYIKENKYIKKDKYVIFKPSGRLGNAIFIYLASVFMCIKHNLKYILDEDYHCNCNCSGDVAEKYEYYKGVDHINDDVTCVYNESIWRKTKALAEDFRGNSVDVVEGVQNIMHHSDMNDKVLCFNTLGYLKNNINLHNLQSNQYINNETGHGLFVKNNITITDNNFLYFLDKNVSHANIIMYGQFQFDQIFLEYKIDILQFIEQNKNSHYIKTDRQQTFLIKDIVDDVVLPQSKIYDIVIHIRLGDFNGRPDFIEYEYYEKLFESIDLYDKKICIVIEHVTNENDKRFLEKCINWFETKNIPIHIESNELLIDFNIMKQTKILVCSMSTLSWMAAYFSKILEKCYMPNYILYGERKNQTFKKPIENTVLYDVKSTLFIH